MINSKSPTPTPTSSNCFSTILQHLICSNNLLTHTHPSPSPSHLLLQNLHHHHHNSAIVAPNYQVQCQAQITQEPNTNPGIIARLMGLDSLPNPHHRDLHDSLSRSKSLNSLRFLPDFDPARVTFHRRARTSSSFHDREIGRKCFPKIDENSEIDGRIMKECEVRGGDLKGLRKQRGEKMAALKGNEVARVRSGKNRESRDRRREKSNRGIHEREKKELIVNKSKERKGRIDVPSKIKNPKINVDLVQRDAVSRSPDSVLDHFHHHRRRHRELNFPPKGDSRQVISSPRRKCSHKKLKNLNEMPSQDHTKLKFRKKYQGLNSSNDNREENQLKMKAEIKGMVEVEFFGKFCLGKNCKSNKWIRKFQVFKVGFLQGLGKEISHDILDFLIHELMNELNVN